MPECRPTDDRYNNLSADGRTMIECWHTTKRLLQLKKSATDSKIITWHDGHKNWSVDTKKKKSIVGWKIPFFPQIPSAVGYVSGVL